MYSEENDVVLDQFVGSGTTILEACRLGRKSIGIDINNDAIKMSIDRLKASSRKNNTYILKKHDARNLNFIGSESIGLICTHPPYANIIKYSKDIEGDISLLEEEKFYKANVSVKGSGIGLAVTSEIVNLHNGYLDIDSVEGKGTLVTILLPLIDSSQHS